MTTPTPRTDAIQLTERGAAGLLQDYCELARQLERDLAARDAELAELRADCAKMMEGNAKQHARAIVAEQRAEAAERQRAAEQRVSKQFHDEMRAALASEREWKRKAEEAARDAERYRWIRRNGVAAFDDVCDIVYEDNKYFPSIREAGFSAVDAVIDAELSTAIAAKGEA